MIVVGLLAAAPVELYAVGGSFFFSEGRLYFLIAPYTIVTRRGVTLG